ncbi:peptidoglycan recognition family protein [Roseovarius sp. M141]|uniref:peptidoglycan recognition protein family protein n=1 Tax=Roseovarius sp. M141 TaxID=2583806 RepID=UPI0020CDF64D|nr:peptidoglycan recognition family protein [Roseovarius sp. M141]MCQ0092535.1 N-acetylmuramoyl-L-alanine amidase [Roseovarius sp. M141]
MPPPFLNLTPAQFSDAVKAYAWSTPKTEIHVHHTWRPNHSQYRGLPTIQGMYNYHTGTNHWSDIAQHVSIGPDGSIWTGRAWSRSPASASGFNGSHVFMFETIGDFDTSKDPLTRDQLDAVLHVVASLQRHFSLTDPDCVRFHNQMSGKTCPGSSIDRAAFLEQVAEKRAALEGPINDPGMPGSGTATMDEVMAAITHQGNEAIGDDGDAELSHDGALAAFMERVATNPFRSGATTEALGADAVTGVTMLTESAAGDDEQALFAELGRRAMMMEADAATAGQVGLGDAPIEEVFFSSFADLGRRIFERVEGQLYHVMCGTDGKDATDRAKLRDAFGLGTNAVTAAIVTVLTGSFGLAPAIAAVAAALLIRVVLKPAYGTTCEFWAERLPPA